MSQSDQLRQYRESCEKEAHAPAAQIEVTLLTVLADICELLGYSAAQRDDVLGPHGERMLSHDRDWQSTLHS
jgi:hypothetical protein